MTHTTLCEYIEHYATSSMPRHLTTAVDWSKNNLMNVNWLKTKEMILGPMSGQAIPQLTLDGKDIERVYVYKLLGLHIEDSLKWNCHVDSICSKASSRLHFLNVLKRSNVSPTDLLHFYTTAIRTVLEYACAAWHTSLTVEQTHRIEGIQKRALHIIFGYNNDVHQPIIETLHARREELCKIFFSEMCNVNSCLNYLLPTSRDSDNMPNLRQFQRYIAPTTRTVRYQKSFVIHAIEHYQSAVIN